MPKKQSQPEENIDNEFEQQLGELTLDLQRTRADFENYRKRVDAEKAAAAKSLELAKGTGTAAVTTPAKPAAAATGGAFAVQLLATSDKAKADALAKTFAGEGYKTSVNTVKVDGKTVYRVVAGGYADKVAASAAQAKMKTRYSQNRDVQNSFVTSSK